MILSSSLAVRFPLLGALNPIAKLALRPLTSPRYGFMKSCFGSAFSLLSRFISVTLAPVAQQVCHIFRQGSCNPRTTTFLSTSLVAQQQLILPCLQHRHLVKRATAAACAGQASSQSTPLRRPHAAT